MRCEECKYYLKEFSFCTSGNIIFVDPDAPCISAPEQKVENSPCKQLTPYQYSILKKTDLIMRWDSEGWLDEVSVRGLPNVPALRRIPHEAITFGFFDQLCVGQYKYSRNANNPAILIFGPLLNEMEFYVYKQWNADRFPPGSNSLRLPAFSTPQHLDNFKFIARLVHHRYKVNNNEGNEKLGNPVRCVEFVHMDGDVNKTLRMWQDRGYQGGVHSIGGRDYTYFAYNFRNVAILIFVGDQPEDVNVDSLLTGVVFQPTNEEEPLGRLNLTNRCIVCGFPNPTEFDITYPCHFCLRRISDIVFRPDAKGRR